MLMKTSLILILMTFLVACTKRDPTPELRDPLFLALENAKKEAEQSLVVAHEHLAEAEALMVKVVPQTGQIKYATKRLQGAKLQVTRASQQVRYFEIKIEAQRFRSREEYTVAHFAKQPWPRENDREDFLTMKREYEKERAWSSKSRRENLGLPVGRQKPFTSETKEAGGI